MYLAKYKVQPRDVRLYTVDCSNWLGDTEVLESPTPIRLPVDLIVSGNDDGTFVARDLQISTDGKKFSFYAGGGQDGERVVVTCVMHTSDKQRKEDELVYFVRDFK